MTKIQLPCVVCATIIHTGVNTDPATVVCGSCRRQGKGPKAKRIRHCPKCGCVITKDNARKGWSRLCASCHQEWHRAREEKKAQREQAKERLATAPVAMYAADDDMTMPDTAVFGGYEWGSATVNPVG